LPPSTNIVNKRKSFGPVNKSIKTGGGVTSNNVTQYNNNKLN